MPELRVESARALTDLGLKGYAIGGLAVGEPQAVMLAMIETVEPHLPAGKPRYLMGVGTPRRPDAVGDARHRHVRLRDADPRRPPRPRLYEARPDQPAQRPPRRGHAAAGRGLGLPGGAGLFTRLSPPPRPVRRDPGDDAADLEQPRLLSGADGRHARGDRGRAARGFRGRDQGRLGAGRGRREGVTAIRLSAGRRASGPCCNW
ncbi:protein of unknown function [Methylorubrum extorquens]|uniref:tRNA-guanine(15) transglycosylase-like domain-containing protein n=1 Tax=Methylorubrum extorquens TaxID=408 RepID=A0A2N9APR1_METEX|nr:protein of unknown function [Methylorubrum extorquens]